MEITCYTISQPSHSQCPCSCWPCCSGIVLMLGQRLEIAPSNGPLCGEGLGYHHMDMDGHGLGLPGSYRIVLWMCPLMPIMYHTIELISQV